VNLNISTKAGITAALMIAVSAFLAGVAFANDITNVAGPDSAHGDDVTWVNWITVEKNGKEIARFHNTLTDQGQDFIRDKIVGQDNSTGTAVTTKNASYISLGNGTTVNTGDTILDSEIDTGGLKRDVGQVTVFGNSPGEFKVVADFTATKDIGVVNTTGLNWNSTGPSLVSGGSFNTEANILTDDSLTVTHNITISEGS